MKLLIEMFTYSRTNNTCNFLSKYNLECEFQIGRFFSSSNYSKRAVFACSTFLNWFSHLQMINTSQADRRAGTLVLKSRRQEKIFDILLAHGEKQRNNIFADPNELGHFGRYKSNLYCIEIWYFVLFWIVFKLYCFRRVSFMQIQAKCFLNDE